MTLKSATDPDYSRLYGWVGIVFMVVGGLFLLVFAAFVVLGSSPVPTDAVGHYFVAFAASATFGWGACLRAAATDVAMRRSLALPTAAGMALMGLYRAVIVVSNADVRAWAGWVPGLEAVALAILVFAFARHARR